MIYFSTSLQNVRHISVVSTRGAAFLTNFACWTALNPHRHRDHGVVHVCRDNCLCPCCLDDHLFCHDSFPGSHLGLDYRVAHPYLCVCSILSRSCAYLIGGSIQGCILKIVSILRLYLVQYVLITLEKIWEAHSLGSWSHF